MKPIMKNIKKYIIVFILFCICFVLIWPAIANSYPLVYPDTGTYIAAGYTKEVPIDRPIIYCLFVRHMSLSHSLWFVLFVQVFIVVYTIYMLVRKFSSKNALWLSTIIILILSFTTSLSNYTSQIMPDIYSSLSIIGIAIILTTNNMKKKEFVLAIIVVFSVMVHLSNFFVLLGIMLLTFFLMLFCLVEKKIFYRAFIISVIPILCTFSINKIYSGKFQISRASNVFILGRMIEMGVVKNYLNEHCNDNNYILCDRIDRIPDLAYKFIWDRNSPLYDGNCNQTKWSFCWEEKNDEFGRLIVDIISTRNYRNQLLNIYMKDFFRQNIDFSIGNLDPKGMALLFKNGLILNLTMN